ncbi:hypothetical protein EV121DRAFT_289560 [Schizophyllum commune]
MFATSACRTTRADGMYASTTSRPSFQQFQAALRSSLTPHEYEQYLALTKLWSHRRINIDMYATGVLGLLQSHPELLSGFAAFFPPARDVLVSSTSSRATRDPLGQPPTAVPPDTKQVVEEFFMAVKERFADRPIVYDTFLQVLQKYRKDKQETINTITTLLGGDPDLMDGLKELDLLYHIHSEHALRFPSSMYLFIVACA